MGTQVSQLDEVPPGTPLRRPRSRWPAGRVRAGAAELGALLAAPVAVFFGLRELPMAAVAMIDRYFYQAYTEHGADLVQRYGTGGYYWVRLGFSLPSRLCYLLFGAANGFLVFRYLLALIAILPAYLLFRRLHGRGAGAVAVAAVLSSPVIVYAWGTDYPDSSAVSYLVAGMCLVLMPSPSRRARLAWVTGGGIMLSLALHSQAVSAPLVGVIVAVHLAGELRRSWRRALVDAGVLLAAVLAVTGVLMLFAHAMYGQWNIIRPTLTASQHLRTPAELRKWHTVDWRWVLRDPYLAVPLLALIVWLAARLAARKPAEAPADEPVLDQAPPATGPSPHPESALAAILLLQVAFFTWWQFFDKGYGLEYHFASSMLWPATVLVLAAAVVRVSRPLLRRAGTAAVPALLVLAVPYALTFTRGRLIFGLVPALLTAAVLALVVAAYARWQPDPVRHAVTAAVLAAAVGGAMTGSGYVLTAGERLNGPFRACQRPFPQPNYGDVLRTDRSWRLTQDQYRLAAELNESVPPATHKGDDLMMWYPARDPLASSLSAQFLWSPNALRPHLPTLTSPDVHLLDKRHPATLLLMGSKDTGFDLAVSELSQAGAPMNVASMHTLTAGPYTFHVWVLTSALYDATLVSHHAGIPTRSSLVPCGTPAPGA
ncbi:MAG: Dolichyl-phosphate-mannose-protein mannosyltransferase, partial [Frankiales bacterium]|nr:Dolichyl-phosphate-mannose-protein mannosyltransferase [Frankiales bacterium]